jgi:hypothetical protein
LGSLTISGPGIKDEITADHEGGMMKLEKSGFFDSFQAIKPPENLGEGYTITAHLNLDGKLVPFVQMVYYPTQAGESPYVHYTGRLNGESLQPVDEWGKLSPDADAAFRGLMDFYGVALQSALVAAPAAEPAVPQPAVAEEAAPAVVPVTSSAIAVNPYLIAGLVTALLVLRRWFVQRRFKSAILGWDRTNEKSQGIPGTVILLATELAYSHTTAPISILVRSQEISAYRWYMTSPSTQYNCRARFSSHLYSYSPTLVSPVAQGASSQFQSPRIRTAGCPCTCTSS